MEEHKWPCERHWWGKRYPTTIIQSHPLHGCGSENRKCAFYIYSMDRKLGQKEGARTHPQQHHLVPQGGPFFKKFWPTTGSPQTMPIVATAQLGQHYTPTTTHFLRGWRWICSTESFTSRQTVPAIQPGSYTLLTDWPDQKTSARPTEWAWQRSKVTQRERAPTPTSAGPARLQAQLEVSKPASPTHQIKVNWFI